MEGLFLKIVNISITAAWTVAAVLVLRLFLKKAPKWIRCAMWAVAGIRLLLPFSIESAVSLIPSASTVTERELFDSTPTVQTGIPSLNIAINPILTDAFRPSAGASVNPLQVYTFVAAWLWVIVMAALAIYAAVSYLRIQWRLRESVPLYGNVRICDRIPSPFILGLIRPKIYLPSNVNADDIEFILEHERAHLKRLDHIWKPLGFLLLTVHWFNPMVWVAYILLCRDIELACDERVIKEQGDEYKKAYSEALIGCAVPRRFISACPLAFGESGIKGRIKSVLSFKKPTVWVLIASAVALTVLTVCFLTNPHSVRGIQNQTSGGDTRVRIVDAECDGISPYIEIERKNSYDTDMTYGDEFYVYRNVDGKWVDCRVGEGYMWHSIAYSVGAGHAVTQRFSLSQLDMWQTGRYKLEVFFSLDGQTENKSAWVEFDLTRPIETIAVRDLTGKELVYADGRYSYVTTDVKSVCFRLLNGMNLVRIGNKSSYDYIGTLEEIKLTHDTFDSRFSFDFDKAASLRRGNKRAWQLEMTENGINNLYLLLEQKNGKIYLCTGYYNIGSVQPLNPDDSHIRFMYETELTEGFNAGTTLPATKMFDSYTYTDGEGFERTLYLYYDGTFSLNEHPFSSYLNGGTYYFSEDALLLRTHGGDRTLLFDVDGSTLKFNKSGSTALTGYSELPDGAEFKKG